MTSTLSLTEEQEEVLREQAALNGKSLEEALSQALLEYKDKTTHQRQEVKIQRRGADRHSQDSIPQDEFNTIAENIMQRDAEILRRLGE